MYYLGYDIGSSSIKISIVHASTGTTIGICKEPGEEMPIESSIPGWAEQDPEDWWCYAIKGTKSLLDSCNIDPADIQGIGIAYQMHGLVLLDAQEQLLRNSIIWCDSRAVPIGEQITQEFGKDTLASTLLNAPGNLTLSKLKWVKEHEPERYHKIAYVLLPGDYLAFKLSGSIHTTIPGLSEGVFWDFKAGGIATWLLDHVGLDKALLPPLVPTFGIQGKVSRKAADETGLAEGTPILYRAGDQPNNALTLSVLSPGEVAMTCGTSGVSYAIVDQLRSREISRINTFAHVTYSPERPILGKLVCLNGAGILYRWLRDHLNVSGYEEMNALAAEAPIGADGLLVFPFGNGAERLLFNKNLGCRFVNLDLNRHSSSHLCRAALEGIAFAFYYGIELQIEEGLRPEVFRAGSDNLFQSAVFSSTLSTLIGHPIELYKATGAVGAARACSIAEGGLDTFRKLSSENDHEYTVHPLKQHQDLKNVYQVWKNQLLRELNQYI